MDQTQDSEKKKTEFMSDMAQPSEIIGTSAPSEPLVPCLPNPSIKFRHSLPIPGANQENPERPEDKNKSRKSSSPKKKNIVLVLGLFTLALFGMVANILFPMVANQFFPPKWVADFRNARTIGGHDWAKGKPLMLAALEQGKKENAPIAQQMSQRIAYAQTLEGHGDFDESAQTFHDVSVIADSNHQPDRQGLALLFESESRHLQFTKDFKDPDSTSAQNALSIFEKIAPDKSRQAFAAVAMGKMEGDAGHDKEANKYFSQAENIWSQDQRQLTIVAQNRWREQTIANIKKLTGKSRESDSRAVDLKTQIMHEEQQPALTLLSSKDFDGLEKTFKDARTHRERWRNGYEQTDYLFSTIDALPKAKDADWHERLNLLNDWARAKPNSPIPHMALAEFYTYYAEQARETEDGKAISPEQLKEYRNRLHQGAIQLGQALDKGPLTPNWFSIAQVNLLSNGDRNDRLLYEKLFSEAISNYPDYIPIYINKTYYLQPSFYGKPGEWLAYITHEADKLKSVEGDILYARLIQDTQSQNRKLYKDFPGIDRNRIHRGTAARRKIFTGY